MRDNPVGVFDSGLGGLTCARRFLKLAPDENMVYLGDTARMPYGVRTREEITGYTNDDVEFLQKKGVKMVIAACGTVSSNVPPSRIRDLKVPFVSVIDPTVEAAVKATRNKKIGIIGTEATVKSKVFPRKIKEKDPEIETVSNACPRLVTLVESGNIDADNPETNRACTEYLKPIIKAGVDTLILGCTHFPIIRDIIQKIVGKDVVLIDSGRETALRAIKILGDLDLDRKKCRDRVEYYVTGEAEGFDRVADIFLGDRGGTKAVHVDIEG